MKILGGGARLFCLLLCFTSVGVAFGTPVAPMENLRASDVHLIASPIIPPPSVICDGRRRVCVRWHNIPGGMACSRWELRFYGCRARR